MLDNQRMQCTSKLGEMLSLPRNTQDESDKILTKKIGVASDADFPVRAARDCRSVRATRVRPRKSGAPPGPGRHTSHCDDCRHSVMIELHELAQRHQLDMQTPLLTISKAMRCTRCGAREGMLLAGAT